MLAASLKPTVCFYAKLKGPAAQEETSAFFDSLSLEARTELFPEKPVRNYQPIPAISPEERRPQIYNGGSLKSAIISSCLEKIRFNN